MDHRDTLILNRLQKGIPLSEDPFFLVAEEVNIPFPEFKERYRQLDSAGYISHTGPIYHTRRVGYRTTLMAMECNPADLEECARIVSSHPGVSHCYERGDRFNLWSTLAVPRGDSLSRVTRKMIALSDGAIQRAIFLPEITRFKLRVNFHLGKGIARNLTDTPSPREEKADFTIEDVPWLKILQEGLPVTRYPYSVLEEEHELSKGTLLDVLRRHICSGFIRRVSTILRHRKAGYTSNGMAIWKVSPKKSLQVGKVLAEDSHVSHCYRRRMSPWWQYSHYAMIHGKSRTEVEEIAHTLAEKSCLENTKILFSLKEFKKCRLKLYTDEYSTWPEGMKYYVRYKTTKNGTLQKNDGTPWRTPSHKEIPAATQGQA